MGQDLNKGYKHYRMNYMENSIESGVREEVRNIKNQRNYMILIKGFEDFSFPRNPFMFVA